MAEITLIQAIFGMGNQNHAHVHRNNTMFLDPQNIDKLKMEQYQGGITGSTINDIASMSGGLTTVPRGFVAVEENWNQRRGIGLLRFNVAENALVQNELSIVGYLYGGGASVEGVLPETMFVPVRAWTTVTQSVADANGFPTVKSVVDSSSQFLMGDPNGINKLKSSRPIDIGNEALAFHILDKEDRGDRYDGVVTSNLDATVVVSKTQNLNPTHHTRELLRLATSSAAAAQHTNLDLGIADNLSACGMNEIGISENAFFATMMFSTGTHSMAGFQGFSVGEINQVFDTFGAVLNLTLLDSTNFGEDNTLLVSEAYGSAQLHEVIATELALMTVHLLLQSGLASFSFSATNNPMDFNGLAGTDDGVIVVPAEAMSLLNADEFLVNRVEDFKHILKTHFFAKYSSQYAHKRTVMNVEVSSYMFGETTVSISFNGELAATKTYTNATYMINHTSSNITSSDNGLAEAKAYIQNIQDHFC